MTNSNPVSRARQIVGTYSALAEKCGVTYQAVQKWERRGIVPLKRVRSVERATDGRVKARELNPDFTAVVGDEHDQAIRDSA